MSTKYIKVAVSERLPKEKETLMTSHGWSFWNGHQFEDDDDKPISYINYWLEEVPNNEVDIRKENEEIIMMLKSVKMFFDKTPHLTEMQKPMVLNKIEELLNK